MGFLADCPAPDELIGEPQNASLAPGVKAVKAAALLCCPQARFMESWDREKPLKRVQGPVRMTRKCNMVQSNLQVRGARSVTLGWRQPVVLSALWTMAAERFSSVRVC